VPRPGAVSRHPGPSVLPFTTERLSPASSPPAESGGPSLFDALVDRIAGQGPPAHRVWLPPLAEPATFDEVLGPPVVVPGRGLMFANPQLHGALQVPVAVVDRPLDQRRDLLWFALDGAAGHVAVVGAPRSGKSTALRTLVCGLALAHTPAEARFYCLDFGGGTLASLRDLPHVGGVASRLDPAEVRRTVGELSTLLAERERRPAAGSPHVFLVVDGWSTLRTEFDDLEPVVTDLAGRGLAYGIHVLASANRWLDLRPATRDLFAARLELRLGDPSDSMISRQAAADVPADSPGRGVTSEGLHLLTLRPALTGDVPLAKAVAAAWAGPPAPPVRLLPPALPYADLDQTATTGLTLPIGIAEADLGPVAVDFAADPHFVLFGDQECGKSSFLRALAATVTQRFQPEAARLIVVDYRRSLLGAVQSDHLIGYGTAAPTPRS